MSTDDLPELDAMLDARLRALELHAGAAVSFAAGGAGEDPRLEELRRLVEHARGGGDEPVSFDAAPFDAEAGAPEGLLARAGHELSALVEQVLLDASKQAIVETGPGPRLRTHVGWTGDAVTWVSPGASVAEAIAHADQLAAELAASARRLRLVTMVAVAASRIAVIIAAPGAAVTALPIAYRCVRDVYEQWRASAPDSNTGGAPWQQRK